MTGSLTRVSLSDRLAEVVASHVVENLHEGRDEAVDVAVVVHARCLQHHQSAKQLRR